MTSVHRRTPFATPKPSLPDIDDQAASLGAIFLSEYLLDLNEGAGFLDGLNETDRKKVYRSGTRCKFKIGEGIFFQGDSHTGIWLIEAGRIRTFYSGPNGREITLAYWSPGHFAGGPEVFGRGRHIWSADALEDCQMLFLSGMSLQRLVREVPDVAFALIEGLIGKGKCYSALIQMLGTRSISERLRQLLVILANTYGRHEGEHYVIDRSLTYEQIATIVGATRQWVTQSLEKMQSEGMLKVSRKQIVILSIERLEA